jgi:tetratricopeptide (TPR) repeat protein
MPKPKRLIALLRRRVRAPGQVDPSAVLDPRAMVEASDLLPQQTRGHGDVITPSDIARVAELLRWSHLALRAGVDQNDLFAVLGQLAAIATADGQAVTEPVRRHLALGGGNADPGLQTELGLELLQHSIRTGDPVALNQAVEMLTAAVAATPSDHPNRAGRLSDLSGALRTRFERTRAGADLDEAVRLGREAVDATPVGHPDRPAMLSNLGAALLTVFKRGEVVTDLDEAVTVTREAVLATLGRPQNAGMLAGMLSIFGATLLTRYERSGVGADLDEAVVVTRGAVDATPAGHPDRGGILSNLGGALLTLFERSGVASDLDEAVRVGREAVNATSAGQPSRAGMLYNLGRALRARFKHGVVGADLDEAITMFREAVDATPAGHPDAWRCCLALGPRCGPGLSAAGLARTWTRPSPRPARW